MSSVSLAPLLRIFILRIYCRYTTSHDRSIHTYISHTHIAKQSQSKESTKSEHNAKLRRKI